ncbi:hypothetical protein PIB30_087357 [Stylosanthes scabra]|uniref:Replication factor A C-terminal domain-containing protein n=1 Tax=Stylosanthes scabra TaxID=79078 RepID=A0ABU6RU19_9FABA|nr:hypothetical protein [Stylosanthes scabra]
MLLSNPVTPTQVIKIERPQSVSLSEDFLLRTEYKSISHLKDMIEKSIYVTIETVVDFTPGKSWWYMGCRSCKLGLKNGVDFYSCRLCGDGIQTFEPRYSLHLKVADETHHIASFIIYETVGDAFLGVTTDNLRSTHFLRVPLIENDNEPLMLTQNSKSQKMSKDSYSQVSETKLVEESSNFITPAKFEEKHITCTSFDDFLQNDTLTPYKSRKKEKLKKNSTEFYVDNEVVVVNIDNKKDVVELCVE